MRLGINTYTYMWSIGFPGAAPEKPLTAVNLLEKARELGVRVVQFGPNLPLDRLPEGDLETLLKRATEWGVELELATRGLEFSHLSAQVALAKRLGATLLRTIPELGGQAVSAREIAEPLRAILPVVEREGVKLAFENGKIPARELAGVVEQAQSPLVGIVLDTVNSLAIPEGCRYVAEILAPHTMCLHLKEFIVKRAWHMMGFICEGNPPVKGNSTFHGCLRHAGRCLATTTT